MIKHDITQLKTVRMTILISRQMSKQGILLGRKKGSIYLEHKTIQICIHPNNRASKYMNQKYGELKGKIPKSTIIPGDLKYLHNQQNSKKSRIKKT